MMPARTTPSAPSAKLSADLSDEDRPQMRQARTITARTITDCRELTQRLGLPRELADSEAAARYPLAIPEVLLTRITPGEPNDPVLRQFLPSAEECQTVEGFSEDPLTERKGVTSKGMTSNGSTPAVLRKYTGRALVMCPGTCAANCRFCFRRHYRGEAPGSMESITEALESIAGDPTVSEIILSGGDPLGLAPTRLQALLDYIKQLPYVNRVRIHTRRPILLPDQADEEFSYFWSPDRWKGRQLVFVFHINHPNEVSDRVGQFLLKLRSLGVHLFVQTVLLRGINDQARLLATLYERLFSYGVLPYYLHQLDRVAGAAHFEVDPKLGRQIAQELRSLLPGYLVPLYVREIPGENAKTPL